MAYKKSSFNKSNSFRGLESKKSPQHIIILILPHKNMIKHKIPYVGG
nr:MAG TPA: hypothetical protein [Caudoviricetes sp.]